MSRIPKARNYAYLFIFFSPLSFILTGLMELGLITNVQHVFLSTTHSMDDDDDGAL